MKRYGCRTAHPSEESAFTHARAGQSRCELHGSHDPKVIWPSSANSDLSCRRCRRARATDCLAATTAALRDAASRRTLLRLGAAASAERSLPS